MSTVWQNTAGACSKSFPAAGLPLMGLLPSARPPSSLPCAELFLAGGERRLTPCDGGRPLCRATVGGPLSRPPNPHIGVCKSGALQKKLAPTAPRHPPAYAAETTTSLSPCSLSARQNVSVQVWSGTGVHLANFFFAQPSALFVAAPTTTTTAGPLSPPFLQPSKMAVRLIIFSVVITLCERQVSTSLRIRPQQGKPL